MASPGVVIGGRYRLTGIVGSGGFGTVYRAVHAGTGEEVAVKVLRSRETRQGAAIARFRTEARLCASLRHPNTIRVFDYGQTPTDESFLAMELLRGRDLVAELARVGPMPAGRVVRIALQILKSLAEAHRQGVVHRDLKPSNVLLCEITGETDFIKVIDFGIARTLAGPDQASQATTGELVGTPHYMSPEQVQATAVDGRSDLYSLGVLMYTCLTNTLPFDGPTRQQIMLAQLHDSPPLPSQLVPSLDLELEGIVLRSLEKEPERRFSSALAMHATLTRWQSRQAGARLERDETIDDVGAGSSPLSAQETDDERQQIGTVDDATVDHPRFDPGASPPAGRRDDAGDPTSSGQRHLRAPVGLASGLVVLAGLGVVGWFARGSTHEVDASRRGAVVAGVIDKAKAATRPEDRAGGATVRLAAAATRAAAATGATAAAAPTDRAPRQPGVPAKATTAPSPSPRVAADAPPAEPRARPRRITSASKRGAGRPTASRDVCRRPGSKTWCTRCTIAPDRQWCGACADQIGAARWCGRCEGVAATRARWCGQCRGAGSAGGAAKGDPAWCRCMRAGGATKNRAYCGLCVLTQTSTATDSAWCGCMAALGKTAARSYRCRCVVARENKPGSPAWCDCNPQDRIMCRWRDSDSKPMGAIER